jgi:hypothetical protein
MGLLDKHKKDDTDKKDMEEKMTEPDDTKMGDMGSTEMSDEGM